MKKVLLSWLIFLVVDAAWCQTAQMPTIIVFPSDQWMADHGYVENVDAEGEMQRLFKYADAFTMSRDIAQAIQSIQKVLEERQFKNKDLKAILDQQQKREAAEMAANADGNGHRVSNTTMLIRQANPDIRIDLDYSIESFGPAHNISFSLKAVDAYTLEQCASMQGTIEGTMDPVDLALRKGFSAHCDDFCQQLISYFTDLRTNGRKVVLTFRAADGSNIDFMNGEFGDSGDIYADFLLDWFQQKAVNQGCDQEELTEDFDQLLVRIPMFDEAGKAVNPGRWARQIAKKFQAETGIQLKSQSFADSGLGQVNFLVGGM